VTPRTTDNLIGMAGISSDPAHNCREILATLCLEAIEEIGAILSADAA
jgi:hypothetical protein